MKNLNEVVKMGWEEKENPVVVSLTGELIKTYLGEKYIRYFPCLNTVIFAPYYGYSLIYQLLPFAANDYPVKGAIIIREKSMEEINSMKDIRKEIDIFLTGMSKRLVMGLLQDVAEGTEYNDLEYSNLIKDLLNEIQEEEEITKAMRYKISYLISPLGVRDRVFISSKGKMTTPEFEKETGIPAASWMSGEKRYDRPEQIFGINSSLYYKLEESPAYIGKLYGGVKMYDKKVNFNNFLSHLGKEVVPTLKLGLDGNGWYNALRIAHPYNDGWEAALNSAVAFLSTPGAEALVEGLNMAVIK